MDYTEIFKIIKELVMQYGLWTTVCAISLAVAFPIFVWQFANIVQAVCALIVALRPNKRRG